MTSSHTTPFFSFSFLFFFQAVGVVTPQGTVPIRTFLMTSVCRRECLKLVPETSYTRTVSPKTLCE